MNYQSDNLVKKVVFDEINVAYSVYCKGYEIRKVADFNKIYGVVFFTLIKKDVKSFKFECESVSVGGDVIKSTHEVKNVSGIQCEFIEQIPISQDANLLNI